MMMHRNTDVEQIEICLCLGQISLVLSGGSACGGRNGGARWRPVGCPAFFFQQLLKDKIKQVLKDKIQ